MPPPLSTFTLANTDGHRDAQGTQNEPQGAPRADRRNDQAGQPKDATPKRLNYKLRLVGYLDMKTADACDAFSDS